VVPHLHTSRRGAAVALPAYPPCAQRHLNADLKESWYEKLCRWDEALEAYERRLQVGLGFGVLGSRRGGPPGPSLDPKP
jgi:hypothetical protein